jgi:hypothetical protein
MMIWANEFKEIPQTLKDNPFLRERMIQLICGRRMAGKATEGAGRIEAIRAVLCDLVSGSISLQESYRRVKLECSRRSSAYAQDRRVFCEDWAERLIRTQLSRFYSQSVLEFLKEVGQTECIVPHSSEEEWDSECTQALAGKQHLVAPFLQRIEESYEQGYWNSDAKVPHHPHCTHVVKPTLSAEARLSERLQKAL